MARVSLLVKIKIGLTVRFRLFVLMGFHSDGCQIRFSSHGNAQSQESSKEKRLKCNANLTTLFSVALYMHIV